MRVEGVGKKFSKSLRRSMWYGLMDIARDALGRPPSCAELRDGEFWALRDVSLEVRRGECLGLIGPNGAGKSTLFKLLNGILAPDRGRIEIRGRVGALIELGAGFHPMLTGRDNIYVNGSILGLSKREIDSNLDSIVEFSGLEEFIDMPVKFYSSGMYVRMGFAVAAHLCPDVLLLDEVLAVGDVAFQARCLNKIGEFRDAGTAVAMVSHNMHRIASFCDRVAFLNGGVLEYVGNTGEAIDAYVRFMQRSGAAGEPRDGSDMTEIYGSGRVRITGVSFVDAHGNPTRRIRSGEGVTVRVHYFGEDYVENPLLDLAIQDSAPGNMFQATNRDFGIELGKLGGHGYVEVAFERLEANNEVLSFFVGLWNSRRTELLDWKRHTRLEVAGNCLCSGRMLLDCRWRNVEQGDLST